MAPAVGSLGNIVFLLLFYQMLGPLALAWGYLVAMVLRSSVTVLPVLRHGWKRAMPLHDPRVREMGRLIGVFVFFSVLTRCTPLLERYFASDLPDGQLSYLGYSYKISGIVATVLGTGITTAVFPAMARAYTKDGVAGLVERTEYALRLTLAVALPAVAILSATAVPLVTVLFERGAFDQVATLGVSLVVPIMLVGDVLFRMLSNVLNRTFYVTKDTHTTPMVATVMAILYIFMAGALAQRWGYVGLALAQPLQMGLGIFIVTLLLLRKLKRFHVGALLKDSAIYSTISLLAFFIAASVSDALAFLPALLQLVAAGMVAGLLYIAILLKADYSTASSLLEMGGVQTIGEKLKFVWFSRKHAVNTARKVD
jgi:putative peptidoglycan lipid II flippase